MRGTQKSVILLSFLCICSKFSTIKRKKIFDLIVKPDRPDSQKMPRPVYWWQNLVCGYRCGFWGVNVLLLLNIKKWNTFIVFITKVLCKLYRIRYFPWFKKKLKCFIIFYQACPNIPHTANNAFQRDQGAFIIEGGALLFLAWI